MPFDVMEENPSADLISVKVTSQAIDLIYKEDRHIHCTIGEISMNPIARIPVFNILKSDSEWKQVVFEWLRDVMGWEVTFFEKGDISIQEEIRKWKGNLRLSPTSKITTGTKGILS